MMKRNQSAVIFRVVTQQLDGEQHTAFFGPFLPHDGGAAHHFEAEITHELETAWYVESYDIYIEDLFIGQGESDCRIEPTK